jgi:hypothetical protein
LELSEDALARFRRAELASEQARQLLDENERWRRSVLAQLEPASQGLFAFAPRRTRNICS